MGPSGLHLTLPLPQVLNALNFCLVFGTGFLVPFFSQHTANVPKSHTHLSLTGQHTSFAKWRTQLQFI